MNTRLLLIPVLAGSFAANALAADFSCPPAKLGGANFIKGLSGSMFEACSGPKATSFLSVPSSQPHWMMSASFTKTIKTECVASTAPGPNHQKMMRVETNGTFGISQDHTTSGPSTPMMFSAWVFVKSGKVALSTNNNGIIKTAHTTKVGQWEQLRVCTDSASPNVGVISIRGVDAAGSNFYVENAELRQILP